MVNTQTLRADASMLAQDVMGSSWHGIINRLRDAADEIDRLRAARDALRRAIEEANINAADAACASALAATDSAVVRAILDTSEAAYKAILSALAATPAPAPDAEDAHDRSREAMNEMSADRVRYIPPAPDESDELWAGV